MRHLPVFAHAAAINSLMKQWRFGSAEEQIITLGVVSEGIFIVI